MKPESIWRPTGTTSRALPDLCLLRFLKGAGSLRHIACDRKSPNFFSRPASLPDSSHLPMVLRLEVPPACAGKQVPPLRGMIRSSGSSCSGRNEHFWVRVDTAAVPFQCKIRGVGQECPTTRANLRRFPTLRPRSGQVPLRCQRVGLPRLEDGQASLGWVRWNWTDPLSFLSCGCGALAKLFAHFVDFEGGLAGVVLGLLT